MANEELTRRYFNIEDANTRLRGVLRYDGKACTYRLAGRDFNFIVRYLDKKDGPDQIVDVNEDPLVDASAPPLGYVNWRDVTVYLTRLAARRTQQGACESNTLAIYPFSGLNHADHVNVDILYSKSMSDAIKNIYPSFEEALDKINKRVVESCAFSRSLALALSESKTIVLFHRAKVFGLVNTDLQSIIIPEDTMVTSNLNRLLKGTNYGIRYV